MVLYSVEAVALRGPCRVCMIDTEISNTFLESSDIVLSLVPDQNWYLKVDQISPTLISKDIKVKDNVDSNTGYSSLPKHVVICSLFHVIPKLLLACLLVSSINL